MLVSGETLLKNKLSRLAFLVYWLVCFALTTLAILVAFLDVRAVQRRIRREQRDLLDRTLKNIEKDAQSKRRG